MKKIFLSMILPMGLAFLAACQKQPVTSPAPFDPEPPKKFEGHGNTLTIFGWALYPAYSEDERYNMDIDLETGGVRVLSTSGDELAACTATNLDRTEINATINSVGVCEYDAIGACTANVVEPYATLTFVSGETWDLGSKKGCRSTDLCLKDSPQDLFAFKDLLRDIYEACQI